MKYARLFRDNTILVSAEDIKNGLYSRNEEFVDPEYEFKVQYVKGARNGGGPYFRLYYSYEEYKKLFPDRASRYEIVANMRRFQESRWHEKWKENVSAFCEIEHCMKHPVENTWKYADAYYPAHRLVLEFQHSYIALDFEERNKFYAALSLNIIWLYDLSKANIQLADDGNIEILEDNARGFFRISECPENLRQHNVFIQVKSGQIFRVRELLRRSTSTDRKSTIRYFYPAEEYTEKEFVETIRKNEFSVLLSDEKHRIVSSPKPLQDLWKSTFLWMVVKNTINNKLYIINRDHQDNMFRDFKYHCIQYSYANNQFGGQYSISRTDEKSPIWLFMRAKTKTGKNIL